MYYIYTYRHAGYSYCGETAGHAFKQIVADHVYVMCNAFGHANYTIECESADRYCFSVTLCLYLVRRITIDSPDVR